MNQKLQDEYAALQWHKIWLRKNINSFMFPILLNSWLREEIKRADKRQNQIKKEIDK